MSESENGNGKPSSDREINLIITMRIENSVYQPVGIKKESTALGNEMASIFMLEKAKKIVEVIHTPRITRPQQKSFLGGVRNLRRR